MAGKDHRQAIEDLHRWMHVFNYALTIDGCTLLARTADEVFSFLSSQVKILEETKRISNSLPVLLRSAEEAMKSTETLQNTVSALRKVDTAVADIARGVQKLLNHEEREALEIRDGNRHELLQWISNLDFRPKHTDILILRSPNTGT